jgi:hypothetical protein
MRPEDITIRTYREIWEWYLAKVVAEAKKNQTKKQAEEVSTVSRLFGVDPEIIEKALKEGGA